MQLASQPGESDQKMSPPVYAALVDSLFQNAGPLFAGAALVAVAAAMTAVKTGVNPLWPCVGLLIASGVGRALDMRRYYNTRKPVPTAADTARREVRYQIGAIIYAAALGIWCTVCLLSSDDAVAHMICVSDTAGYIAAGAGRTYGRPWIFHMQVALAF